MKINASKYTIIIFSHLFTPLQKPSLPTDRPLLRASALSCSATPGRWKKGRWSCGSPRKASTAFGRFGGRWSDSVTIKAVCLYNTPTKNIKKQPQNTTIYYCLIMINYSLKRPCVNETEFWEISLQETKIFEDFVQSMRGTSGFDLDWRFEQDLNLDDSDRFQTTLCFWSPTRNKSLKPHRSD